MSDTLAGLGEPHIQGYNAQAAVDGAHQIIVAQTLTSSASDQAQLAPLLDGIISDNLSAIVDASYRDASSVRAIDRGESSVQRPPRQQRNRDQIVEPVFDTAASRRIILHAD